MQASVRENPSVKRWSCIGWRAPIANYELQADHAVFGAIALSLVFGPHVD